MENRGINPPERCGGCGREYSHLRNGLCLDCFGARLMAMPEGQKLGD